MIRRLSLGALLLCALCACGTPAAPTTGTSISTAPLNTPVLVSTATVVSTVTQTPIPTFSPPESEEQESALDHGTSLLSESDPVAVVRVIDGDTIVVAPDVHVRLVGIDTPETGTLCAREATDLMKQLVSGTQVVLVRDPTTQDLDGYGRSLRYVTTQDGRDVGSSIVRAGLAYEYTFKNKPYLNQFQYQSDEAAAQQDTLGLWKTPDTPCSQP